MQDTNIRWNWLVTLGCILFCGSAPLAARAIDPQPSKQSELQLRAIDGEPLTIGGSDKHPWTTFIFTSPTCPIANSCQPCLRELQAEFEKQGVRFVQVYVQPDITVETARAHVKEFDLKSQIVLDPDKKLAAALVAKVTPEAIVVDRAGSILYRGRINDQFVALGKKRPQPTRHDLEIALREITAGQKVSVPNTTAVGCLIHY